MRVGPVPRQHIGGRERFDARDNLLLPERHQIHGRERPAVLTLAVAGTVVHAEPMQRIRRVRMFGVHQQPPVGELGIEDPMHIKPGAIISLKIVFRKPFIAMRTGNLPRSQMNVHLPMGRRRFADWAKDDHAASISGNGRPEHEVPQFGIAAGMPGCCPFDQAPRGIGAPRIGLRVPAQPFHHRFCNEY